MDRTLWMRRAAVVFVTICLLLLAAFYLAWPKTLRVAVGPADSVQHRYVQAMARALKEQQKPFRLVIVPVADSAAASKLLDARRVDLAVLRSDDDVSQEARSLAILGKRSIVLVTRDGSGVDAIKTLAGRRIAIISPGGDHRALVERIAAHYGTSLAEAKISEFTIRQFAASPQDHDAYVIIADPAFSGLKSAIDAITSVEDGAVSFVGMPGASGLALRVREVQKSAIPEGAFGGSPPKPDEEIETVALTYELAASSRVSLADGLELLGALVDLRTRLRRLMPQSTFDVEAPPVDEQRRFLPHVGAAAYVNDEEPKTFFDNWSEQIWLGIFLLSIAGSSITGFLAWSGFFDQPQSTRKLQARMSQLARRLASPDDPIDLDAAQREIDDIVIAYLRENARAKSDTDLELSFALWTNALAAIIERRRTLHASRQ